MRSDIRKGPLALAGMPRLVDDLVMTRDRNGLEVLTRAECLQLLEAAHVGRIGVTVRALPVILPVNYAMFDESILVRTTAGTKLDAAAMNAVVAFEVDSFDPLYHSGWSVLAQGIAREVTDPFELERIRRVPLVPWSGADGHYVCIKPDFLSGRRLTSG